MSEQHRHDALNCKEVFSLLSEYIDGELPPETCQEVREHIHDCAPCIEFLESLKKSVSLVHGHQPDVDPGHLPPHLRETLLRVYRAKLAAQGRATH